MEIKLKTGILNLEKNDKLLDLTGFSSRINKKRGFLFISKVLGKHIPCRPTFMEKIYLELADKIKKQLNDKPSLVIGFAETATSLGNGVYEKLNLDNSFYIHTTRYKTSKKVLVDFKEEHSHAPSQFLYFPEDLELVEMIDKIENIILVDDELTTGKTIENIVKQLKINLPHVKNYYFVSILNWINKPIENNYIHIYKDTFDFESYELDIDENIVSETIEQKNLDEIIPYNFGRFGIKKINYDFETLLHSKNLSISEIKDKKILVLGTAEFMYLPYKFAYYLEENGIKVYYQSTTRSPINIDGDILSKIQFKDNYFENIDNFLYNVIDKEYDYIFVCYETTLTPENHNLIDLLEDKKYSFIIESFNFSLEQYLMD
ncbi:MAG: phosphoribosyltransferase domain-containing protein [Cyanobacteriota bacterium]